MTEGAILIVGAGIAGLASALALALARSGQRIRVFEARASLDDSAAQEGAGIQIGPNGVKALVALGIADRVALAVSTPDAIVVADAVSGGHLTRLPLGRAMAERHGAPYWTVRRSTLHGAILSAVQAHGAIEIVDRQTVRETRDLGGSIELTVGDRTYVGAALVIADGAGSTLRARVHGQSIATRPLSYSAARAVVPLPVAGPFASGDVGLWLAPSCHIVHYPVSHGQDVSIVAVTRDGASNGACDIWHGQDTGANIARRLGPIDGALREAIAGIETWRKWPLFDSRSIVAAPWARGRAVLIGDAAHPILPYLAQGAVLALEDALALAGCLVRDEEPARAFRAFEVLRRLRVQRVAQAARRNGLIYHQSWTRPRNTVLKFAPPGLLMRGYDWLYGYDLLQAQ